MKNNSWKQLFAVGLVLAASSSMAGKKAATKKEPVRAPAAAEEEVGISSFWPTLPEVRDFCRKKFSETSHQKRFETCVSDALGGRKNPYL